METRLRRAPASLFSVSEGGTLSVDETEKINIALA